MTFEKKAYLVSREMHAFKIFLNGFSMGVILWQQILTHSVYILAKETYIKEDQNKCDKYG